MMQLATPKMVCFYAKWGLAEVLLKEPGLICPALVKQNNKKGTTWTITWHFMQCSAGLFGRSSGAFSTWDCRVTISWHHFLLKTGDKHYNPLNQIFFGTTEQLPPFPMPRWSLKSSHCLWNFFCQEIWILCPLAVAAAAAGASWLACCQRLE